MKNYILGFCFLAGAFYLIWKQSEDQIERAKESNPPPSSQNDTKFAPAVFDANNSNLDSDAELIAEENTAIPNEPIESEILTQGLSNDSSSLTFTSYLGGLRALI